MASEAATETAAVITGRRRTARLKLAAFALDRPDEELFLADTIAALGLHPDNDPEQESR